MRTRIFRLLVCLVLVAALLVQVSPIQAKADGNNFFYIDPELQLVSDLIGLGISVGTDAAAHNQVIQDAADWLSETGEWLSEGMLKVYKVAAAAGGFRYMVDADFLQELFEWLFDAEVVSGGPCAKYTSLTLPSSPVGPDLTFSSSSPFAMFAYKQKISSVRTDVGFVIASSSSASIVCSNGSSFPYHKKVDSAWINGWFANGSYVSEYPWGLTDLGVFSSADDAFYAAASAFSGSDITTDKDLTLNHIGAFGSILPEVYTDWFANSSTITDTETGEEKTVVPIGLGQSVEETQGMTQEDIWAGTSTYEDTITDTETGTGTGSGTITGTGTIADVIAAIKAIPASIADFFTDVVTAVKSVPAAITDFFTIQSDVDALAVSWADFFPFCIPGDIRDLVLVFDADPEAPHFVFDVDFPYMNEPWHIDLDFSEWDPVAMVLRRLELLLFIVGLAMATRNYYIRG